MGSDASSASSYPKTNHKNTLSKNSIREEEIGKCQLGQIGLASKEYEHLNIESY